jgi:hypothetical protein
MLVAQLLDTWDVYASIISFRRKTHPYLSRAIVWTADKYQSIASRSTEYRRLKLILSSETSQLRPHLGNNAGHSFMLCGVTAPSGLLRTAESNLFAMISPLGCVKCLSLEIVNNCISYSRRLASYMATNAFLFSSHPNGSSTLLPNPRKLQPVKNVCRSQNLPFPYFVSVIYNRKA